MSRRTYGLVKYCDHSGTKHRGPILVRRTVCQQCEGGCSRGRIEASEWIEPEFSFAEPDGMVIFQTVPPYQCGDRSELSLVLVGYEV